MAEANPKTRRWETFWFALPAAPLMALSLPPIIFLPPYFNEHLGVGLYAISAIFLAARVFDIIIDPMLGGWQDRTESAFGRRRLWIAAGTPVLCAAIYVVFLGFQPGVSPLLLGLAMLTLYAAFAAIMIAHLGWAGELRTDYHGRTQILGAVQIASACGQIGVLMLPAAIGLMGLGADGAGVRAMGITILIALPLTIAILLITTPERRTPPQPHLGLKEAFAALMENRALRRVLAPDLLIGITQGVSGGLFVFFFEHRLGFEGRAEALLLLYFVSALAAVPLWVMLAKRTSKHRAVQICCLYAAATQICIPFLPPGNVWIAAPGMLIAGATNGAHIFLLRAMMADVVDEDRVRTGVQRSGLFFGLLLTTSKLGLAMGPLTYAVLAVFGFDAKLGEANSVAAMTALTALFAGVPAALNLLCAWLMKDYPLDEARQRALRAAIDAHAPAEDVPDAQGVGSQVQGPAAP